MTEDLPIIVGQMNFHLLLDGKLPGDLGINPIEFTKYSVRHTCDGFSTLLLQFEPANFNLLDCPYLYPGHEVELWTGYPNDKDLSRVYQGRFKIVEPVLTFEGRQRPILRLECKAVGLSLTDNEKQRVFRNLTNSDLARAIASEHHLNTRNEREETIDNSRLTFEMITQAGETDFDFLRRRAFMDGFFVFVDGDVLYYRRPRFRVPSVSIGPEFGVSISQLRTWVHEESAGITVQGADFDPLTGMILSASGDADTSDLQGLSIRGFQEGQLLSSKDVGSTKTRFLVGAGARPSYRDFQSEVAAAAQASSYFCQAEVTIHPYPSLRVLDCVTFYGFGHFEGLYLVIEVTHESSEVSGQRTSMRIVRPFDFQPLAMDKLLPRTLGRSNLEGENVDTTELSIEPHDQRKAGL